VWEPSATEIIDRYRTPETFDKSLAAIADDGQINAIALASIAEAYTGLGPPESDCWGQFGGVSLSYPKGYLGNVGLSYRRCQDLNEPQRRCLCKSR
jgi:hypothetical protein